MKSDTFATRLHLALQEKNVRPIDLAKKIRVAKSSVSHYLAGSCEPKSDKLLKIAEYLDVNEIWLMGYDVPKKRDTVKTINKESTLHTISVGHTVSALEDELLIKCTMLNEFNQSKILELVDLYLKNQGDLELNTKYNIKKVIEDKK